MKLKFTAMALLFGFFIATGPVFAQADTPASEMPSGVYKLDPAHASLVWKVSHLGLSNYTARFTKFDVDLTYDPQNPESSSVTVVVDPTSIETDFPNPEETDFNKKLSQGEDWFNAGQYPEIKFQSTSLKKMSDTEGIVTGDLTFLGVTKPVSLDVTFNGGMIEHPYNKKPTLGFSAKGMLKRSEWGMNHYVPNIGDEVQLLIEAELIMEQEDSP